MFLWLNSLRLCLREDHLQFFHGFKLFSTSSVDVSSLLGDGRVYNALDVASYTTRAYVCGLVNVANDVLEMLSKCNNILVHAIAIFFVLIGNLLWDGSQYIVVGPTLTKLANSMIA